MDSILTEIGLRQGTSPHPCPMFCYQFRNRLHYVAMIPAVRRAARIALTAVPAAVPSASGVTSAIAALERTPPRSVAVGAARATGIEAFAAPVKAPLVPVAPPVREIVRPVASAVAVATGTVAGKVAGLSVISSHATAPPEEDSIWLRTSLASSGTIESSTSRSTGVCAIIIPRQVQLVYSLQ